jgi:hypothetical protein
MLRSFHSLRGTRFQRAPCKGVIFLGAMMHTYDPKKWKSSLLKKFWALPFLVGVLAIYALSIFEKHSFANFIAMMSNSFSGLVFLLFIFAFVLIFTSWNKDRKEKVFPKLNVHENYISRVTGVIEERIYVKDIRSYEVNRKGKSNESISINLHNGESVLIEHYFPIPEIEKELTKLQNIARK